MTIVRPKSNRPSVTLCLASDLRHGDVFIPLDRLSVAPYDGLTAADRANPAIMGDRYELRRRGSDGRYVCTISRRHSAPYGDVRGVSVENPMWEEQFPHDCPVARA